MMKKSFKNRSAVSPVIATILMVAITVVLAAVLYVMVMGFGGTSSSAPTGTIAASEKLSDEDLKFQFGAFSKDTQFSDCKLLLTIDGDQPTESPAARTIADGMVFTIDSVVYTLDLQDLTGDGKIANGDYVTISSPSGTDLATGEYILTLIWGQDGSTIGTKSITV